MNTDFVAEKQRKNKALEVRRYANLTCRSLGVAVTFFSGMLYLAAKLASGDDNVTLLFFLFFGSSVGLLIALVVMATSVFYYIESRFALNDLLCSPAPSKEAN